MQTSIATWLQKPAAVTKAPEKAITEESEYVVSHPQPPPSINDSNDKNVQTQILKTEHPIALHSSVTLVPITAANIPHFKRINALLLPIPYTSKFYAETLSDNLISSISLIALWDNKTVIGGIRCRILPGATESGHEKILYISTLTLLSAYRGKGVAAALLEQVTQVSKTRYGISAVGAHVWEANEEGLEWYHKRGFKDTRREGAYYPRLKPSGAVVVRLDVE